MAIIIDTNCLPNVLSKRSSKHKDFEPVLNWILKGKGIIIFGGSKYQAELKKCEKYLKLITLLKDVGKVRIGNTNAIDLEEKKIKQIITDKDFDDPHLPAIAKIMNCRVICSEDARSIKFIRNKKLYPKGFQLPVYYCSLKNKNLLSDKYISNDIKSLQKIRKSSMKKILVACHE